MGGFALYDSEGKFLFHLWDERFCEHFKDEEDWYGFSEQQRKLKELLPHGRDQSYSSLLEYCVANNMITMTEDEIQSLGHTDLLAKTITILQILYFITNCIARGIDGLAITELEFFTLGFAALNLVSYSFWWHKPSGVRFPVRVMERPRPISPEQFSVGQNQEDDSNSSLLGEAPPASSSRAPGIVRAFSDRIRDDYGGDWHTYNLGGRALMLIFVLPLVGVWTLMCHAVSADSLDIRPQPERGNVFSAGTTTIRRPLALALAYSTAVILGAFHCIPIVLNHHHLLNHTIDDRLWSVFALLTAGLPLGLGIAHFFEMFDWEKQTGFVGYLTLLAVFLCGLSYSIARIALMVLAVKQLTNLPSSALQQVEWTKLIPHFGV
ncbi:hypothetical protein PQX77_014588 [Marasmius sp. AFHP31]|nr:hypothetical protein PQX77_014588 [Marasmius sp. AFHP31]